MSRSGFTDFLQAHRFWAFEAPNNLSAALFPVFTPLFGFSGISAPEMTVEVHEFVDGTFLFPRIVAKSARTAPIVFQRAASPFDSDFYDWINHCIYGTKEFSGKNGAAGFASRLAQLSQGSVRRNLVVLQLLRAVPSAYNTKGNNPGSSYETNSPPVRITDDVAQGDNAPATAQSGPSPTPGATSWTDQVTGTFSGFSAAGRIPGRAWILHDCLPIRYKSGSEMDANNAAVSIMELEVRAEYIEELSLGV